MIHKKFIAKDIVFICSFSSFDSLRRFEEETKLVGVSIG